MIAYARDCCDRSRFGFSDAYAVITAYIEQKNERGENNPEIERLYGELLVEADGERPDYSAGKIVYSREALKVDVEAGINLLQTCRSIRNYSRVKVKEQDILDAVGVASRAPSACNRQPVKCYYTMNEEKIAQRDRLVPGNTSIKGETPNFIVVTASRQCFELYEYNQWYVNGGIFLGYLGLALHLGGLGNCIYQWPINAKDSEMRELYQIPRSETIVGIVGIGYFAEEAYRIQAQRKRIKDYAVRSD